jgi:hypothetical protein
MITFSALSQEQRNELDSCGAVVVSAKPGSELGLANGGSGDGRDPAARWQGDARGPQQLDDLRRHARLTGTNAPATGDTD